MNESAILLGPGRVVLNRRGAELCLEALRLAHRGALVRHGGAPVTAEFDWLLGVLTIAVRTPDDYEPEGRKVRVAMSERQELSAGSAVAAAGSDVPESASVGAGEYLDTRDAAALLGISDRAVRKACDLGRLRASRVAGHWLIEEADALAYREQRESRVDDRQAAAVG